MNIFKNFIEGTEQPVNYSYWTFLFSLLWDTILCILSFIEAFKFDEANVKVNLFRKI